MNRMVVLMVLACALGISASGQMKLKPWTEWSEKDAKRILDNSPWGQTQTETDTSEMFYRPTDQSSGRGSSEGVTNQATSVNYRIRFLSARPIRLALARLGELQKKPLSPRILDQLRSFAERKFDQWIVIAVTYDSSDGRYSGRSLQAFTSATLAVLKNNTYLELKNGKRIFLLDYKPPTNDGLGAKFIFPRTADGRPIIAGEKGDVRFYSEVFSTVRLNMRFKIAQMTYEGQLEY